MSLEDSPSTGQKRKSPGDEVDERPIKHRASLACQSCRTRKVRCDVLANGSRCTNCRLDKLECIVLPSRRGKTSRRRASHDVQPAQSNATEAPEADEASPQVMKDEGLTTSSNRSTAVPACVSFEEDNNVDGDEQPARDHPTGSGTDPSQTSPYVGLLTPDIRTDTLQQQSGPNALESIPLPAFIAPLSARLLPEDLEFLHRKGALTIPDPDLRIEIVRAYMFSVHPFMPMLDYRAFIVAMLGDGKEDCRISLLLFQAVMFAGLHSLELSVIHRLGFQSAKQARAVLFNRIRLLYEFDVEPDIAAVLQALILMSSWYSKWDGRRDTWHWTGLAYDVARRMGLHRESPTRCTSNKAHRFRRRLWWSLYIRDRMIALGTRRPMRIQDEDFDVSMLSLQDFDLAADVHDGSHAFTPPPAEMRLTALMCIQLANLCRTIGRVVKSQYTMTRSQPDQDIPNSVMVVSRRDATSAKELQICDKQLNEWFEALPKAVESKGSTADANSSGSCSDIHWTILILTYQTTINVLHRAQALKPTSDTDEAQQRTSRSKIKSSARSLTKLSQNMLRLDQVRFLSLIGVTALIAAYLSHMLDLTSTDEDVRDAATLRLQQSVEVLSALRQVYASADAAITFLVSVSRKAGAPIPIAVTESASGFGVSAERLSGNSDQSGSWKGLAAVADEQYSPRTRDWFATLGTAAPQLASTPSQQSRISARGHMLTPNGFAPSNPGTMSVSTLVADGAPNGVHEWAGTGVRNRAYSSPQFVDTTLGSLATSAEGSIFDWDGSIDFGMDIAPLSFSYDFYSDALGLVDDNANGV